MKATVKLGLLVVLVFAVQVGFAQSGPKNAAARAFTQQVLQHLPGHFGALPARTALNASQDALAAGVTAKVYKFSTNDYPGAALSMTWDIYLTTAVGYFNYESITPQTYNTAFELVGGVYKVILVPGAAQGSIATGINSSSQIVGFYTDSSDVTHAFYDSAGTIETVDNPAGTGTAAFDINDSGDIVGQFVDTSGNIHGYLDVGGTFTQIDDPNAPTGGTVATGINDSGEIVGYWEDSMYNYHGFILSGVAGTFTEVDFPLASDTYLFGVNKGGEVAGYYTDASGVSHGLIYSNGAFSTVDVSGASCTELARIKSNSGAITGVFADALGEGHALQGH